MKRRLAYHHDTIQGSCGRRRRRRKQQVFSSSIVSIVLLVVTTIVQQEVVLVSSLSWLCFPSPEQQQTTTTIRTRTRAKRRTTTTTTVSRRIYNNNNKNSIFNGIRQAGRVVIDGNNHNDDRRRRFTISPLQQAVSAAQPPQQQQARTKRRQSQSVTVAGVVDDEILGGGGVDNNKDENNNDNETDDDAENENENDDVIFPPPLNQVDRLKRAATFWSCAIPIVANYYGLISKIKLQELLLLPLGNDTVGISIDEQEEMWDTLHKDGAKRLAKTVANLKGFYVKTAQIISSREDLFPKQYTQALSGFTDNLDPMPSSLVKAIIQKELLNDDENFHDVFVQFDTIPLGAASVAQVHRAVLSDQYGGDEVAVKVQRPSIESKLMGDIANLKALASAVRDNPSLPLDYYTVFSELEKQLSHEFDFVSEAVAMERIYNNLQRSPITGELRDIPLVIPRPKPGLVSKRVLVMDYLSGVPLSRARDEMIKRGIDPNSVEAKLFGRNLLNALTTVFGRTILETGFFHADPHPGNIFVLHDGQIGLIDYGQVKQISGRNRETLCKVMIAMDDNKKKMMKKKKKVAKTARDSDDDDSSSTTSTSTSPAEDVEIVGKLARELGVTVRPNAKPEAAAAVGIWLFDGSVTELPGGYDLGELSPNSPVKELQSFPQDLVLVGRSSILIKGLSNRLNVPWSLAQEWAPIARQVLYGANNNKVTTANIHQQRSNNRVRFRDVRNIFIQWTKGKVVSVGRQLPSSIRTRIANIILKNEERKSRKTLLMKK